MASQNTYTLALGGNKEYREFMKMIEEGLRKHPEIRSKAAYIRWCVESMAAKVESKSAA